MGLLRETVLAGNPNPIIVAEGFIQFAGDGSTITELINGVPANAVITMSYNAAGGFDGAKAGILRSEVTAVGTIQFKSTSATDNNRANFRVTWGG